MKMGIQSLVMALCILYVAAAEDEKIARGKDYCIPGSDSLCKRWGSDYCCARIEIKYKTENKKAYHACASAEGVAATGGEFSGGPYSGTWFCAGAMERIQLSFLAVLGALSVYFA